MFGFLKGNSSKSSAPHKESHSKQSSKKKSRKVEKSIAVPHSEGEDDWEEVNFPETSSSSPVPSPQREIDTLKDQLSWAGKRADQLDQLFKKAQEELRKERESKMSISAMLESEQHDHEKCKSTLSGAAASIALLRKQKEESEEECGRQQARNSELERGLGRMSLLAEELKESEKKLKEELEIVASRHKRELNDQECLASQTYQMELLHREHLESRVIAQRLQDERDTARGKLEDALSRVYELEQEMRRLRNQLEEELRNKENLEIISTTDISRAEHLTTQLNETVIERENLKSMNDDLTMQLINLETQNAHIRQEAEDKFLKMKAEIDYLKSRLESFHEPEAFVPTVPALGTPEEAGKEEDGEGIASNNVQRRFPSVNLPARGRQEKYAGKIATRVKHVHQEGHVQNYLGVKPKYAFPPNTTKSRCEAFITEKLEIAILEVRVFIRSPDGQIFAFPESETLETISKLYAHEDETVHIEFDFVPFREE